VITNTRKVSNYIFYEDLINPDRRGVTGVPKEEIKYGLQLVSDKFLEKKSHRVKVLECTHLEMKARENQIYLSRKFEEY